MQVPGKQGAMPSSVMTDEALLKVKPDKLRNLPPAFVMEGGDRDSWQLVYHC